MTKALTLQEKWASQYNNVSVKKSLQQKLKNQFTNKDTKRKEKNNGR